MTCTVLVVDDDAAFRHLATRLLRIWGYQVVGEAGSVTEALAQAAELHPAAALVDVARPDGNGFDLSRSLRSLPRTVRVVLISADADPGFTAAARRAGAAGFLVAAGGRHRRVQAVLRYLQGRGGPR